MTAEKAGADILIAALLDCGVDTVFGYPGGAVLPIYDSLFENRAHQAISSAAMNRARRMPPRAMRGRPASPAWCS